MGPRAGLDRCGKSRTTGIQSPDRPACSQSLYQLRYPAHIWKEAGVKLEKVKVKVNVKVKVKVKVTLVQALRLCTGRTAHRGSRGIALL